jgi:dihydroneopterin aldolase / 2-amino-4-hydroxy-6-hydroxymethyldihydropteridine diphosphokinase
VPLMLDRISITGLRVRGFHGVFPHERADGQDFVVDAVLWLDTGPAAAADDLSLTADYGAIADRLAKIVAGEPVALIETLAGRLAAACLTDDVVHAAEITVHKPGAPVTQQFADIAVTIRRSRDDPPGETSAQIRLRERSVVLSLGSNMGDRIANLQRGVDVLCGGGLDCLAVSSVYETDPLGGVEQADYLNVVVLARSSLPALDILARCAAAEAAANRVRTVRFGPRTLDVDIVSCDAEISDDPVLTLPHPRAHERAFVLVPWLELDPQAALPDAGPVAALPAAADTAAVRRRPDLRVLLADPEADASCR